jgi:Ca2+-binding EF-hand superfamily protein
MGNLCDRKASGNYNNSSSAKLAEQLGIDNRTLNRLEAVFQEIDFDGSGEVDVSEFLTFFSLERTRFSKRVFSVMDADGSGESIC